MVDNANLGTYSLVPIIKFVAFHVIHCNNGSNPWLDEGNFVPGCPMEGVTVPGRSTTWEPGWSDEEPGPGRFDLEWALPTNSFL